jgi:adenylate cyclase
MARLIIHSPKGRHEADLGDYTTIGRLSRNHIRIDDPLVSKEHCLISRDRKGNYVIRDLGSRNGTFVSGRLLEAEAILKDEDSIGLGATSCIFVSRDAAYGLPEIANNSPGVVLATRPAPIMSPDLFLPERDIRDNAALRSDYEKLRITHNLQRDIGLEFDLGHLFDRILESTFGLLECDRAVIMMPDEMGDMMLRAFKMRPECDRLVVSSTIVKCVQHEKLGIISGDALTDERFDTSESVMIQHIRSSMAVPILYEEELLGVMIIDSSAVVRAYSDKDLQLFTSIAQHTAQCIRIAQMAKKIEKDAVTRERFQRLLSPDLAEMVISGRLKVEKGGQSRVATVLFADIRGFTALCEKMRPDQVLQMLNDYFELLVEVGFGYEGTVDKFVGDMIMMVWGAPIVHANDPVLAVEAAIGMQEALADYNGRRAEGVPEIRVGIGINTGEVMAGYMGSSRTMAYSVIGDSVNIASRICSIAGAGQIVISHDTYTQVSNRFDVTRFDSVSVKGKTRPIKVYQVLGRKISNCPSEKPLRDIV